MKHLFYILRKSFKNTVKETLKKPWILILYILFFGGFVLVFIASLLMPSNTLAKGSAEMYKAIATGVLLVVIYFAITRGMDKGSSFFRLADVNLVFAAPISPKKVLIYGFINQMILSFFLVIFLSFQVPNLKANFPVSQSGILIIYMVILLLLFILPLTGVLLYSVTSRSVQKRTWMERIIYGLLLAAGAGLLYFLLQERDILKAAIRYLNMDFWSYIPFIGWAREMLFAAVDGMQSGFWLNLAFLLIGTGILIAILYVTNTDYYEDVLSATEKKEELMRMKREGKSIDTTSLGKIKAISRGNTGRGMNAIFYRHLLEYRKSGYFFVNKNTLFIVGFGLASKFIFKGADFSTVLYFSIYMLFFTVMQGKWAQELLKPYIYLLPGSSMKKIIYATLSDIVKNAVDGTILFLCAGIMFKANPVLILLSIVAYVSYAAIYLYGDVLSRRMLGAVHSKVLAVFVKMFITLLVLIPGLVSFITLQILSGGNLLIKIYAYLVLVVYNLGVSLVILLASRNIFDNMEMS